MSERLQKKKKGSPARIKKQIKYIELSYQISEAERRKKLLQKSIISLESNKKKDFEIMFRCELKD